MAKLEVTFKGLCLYYLTKPSGTANPPTAYSEVVVLLVNAMKAKLGSPIQDCRKQGKPTLHRHEPYLCFDLDDWKITTDPGQIKLIPRPNGGQYAVYDPTGKDLRIEVSPAGSGPVQVPQKGLKAGDVPSNAAAEKRIDWIPSLSDVLATTTPPKLKTACLTGSVGSAASEPVAARLRLTSGTIKSLNINKKAGKPILWKFSEQATGKATWRQALADGLSCTLPIDKTSTLKLIDTQTSKVVLGLTPKKNSGSINVSISNLPVLYEYIPGTAPLHHFRWYYELLDQCPKNPSPIPFKDSAAVTGANAFCPPAKTNG